MFALERIYALAVQAQTLALWRFAPFAPSVGRLSRAAPGLRQPADAQDLGNTKTATSHETAGHKVSALRGHTNDAALTRPADKIAGHSPRTRTDSTRLDASRLLVLKGIKVSVLAMATATAGWGFALVALAANHEYWQEKYPVEYWRARLNTVLRPGIYDQTGQLAGFDPPHSVEDLNGYAISADGVSATCIDLVLEREDAHRGSLRHAYGVDVLSAVRAVVKPGGASTLPMQTARLLGGWKATVNRWLRKLQEAGSSQTLLDLHGGDYSALAKTYLEIAPFGVAAGDILGITAAADVYFGKAPSQLSRVECALLITMLPVRPRLLETDERAKEAWRTRKTQAEKLLLSKYGPLTEEERKELTSFGDLPPVRPLLDDLPDAATYNLGARTRALVLPHIARIRADLKGER